MTTSESELITLAGERSEVVLREGDCEERYPASHDAQEQFHRTNETGSSTLASPLLPSSDPPLPLLPLAPTLRRCSVLSRAPGLLSLPLGNWSSMPREDERGAGEDHARAKAASAATIDEPPRQCGRRASPLVCRVGVRTCRCASASSPSSPSSQSYEQPSQRLDKVASIATSMGTAILQVDADALHAVEAAQSTVYILTDVRVPSARSSAPPPSWWIASKSLLGGARLRADGVVRRRQSVYAKS